MSDPELSERLCQVRLLAVDVDGVLTDGGVYIGDDGRELRRFDIKDGLGLKQAQTAGLILAIISSSPVEAIAYRAQRLGIEEVHLDITDKLQTLREICERYAVALEQVCYVGDDLVDLPVLQAVGLPCAPADAVIQVQQAARYVTLARGGYGAVREVCDLLVQRTACTQSM